MSFSYGKNIKIQLDGGSHENAVSVSIEGIPAGIPVDMNELQTMQNRRAPGHGVLSTARKESDVPDIQGGLIPADNTENGSSKEADTIPADPAAKRNILISTGQTICASFPNADVRPQDYERWIPRPSHGDYTAWVKAGSIGPIPSGGATSARMTVGLVFAGAICLQILKRQGITIQAEAELPKAQERAGEGDSFGGFVRCSVQNLPVGLGESYFDGLESRISSAIFAIPAAKGIEFGEGFASGEMLGSEYNDAFYFDADGAVKTKTNHCGGILGGMANGMPLTFRIVFKPTPSIAKEQDSIDLSTRTNTKLKLNGRHDKCVVPRAVPIVEAVTAIALLDLMIEEGRIPWKNSENV